MQTFPKMENFFLVTLKLIKYLSSAVNFVSSNPCVGSSPRIKISFVLLSTCTAELKYTPKIITLQPDTPVGNENGPRLSNQIK